MAKTGKPLSVYTLDGLPPEVVAVAFAKTSRVPQSFDEIARELSDEDSSEFHEKWVVGYGHSSVSEHAILSIAIENISILGAKVIEENRLCSFTEKSTRYQIMDPANYYTPSCFAHGEAGDVYKAAIVSLYSTYDSLMPAALRHASVRFAAPEWKERGIFPKAKACDMVRGLLPAAAKTNVGWTANARNLRHAIVKMASHPLSEMRDVSEELLRVGLDEIPTLLRYTDASPYLTGWDDRMAESGRAALGEPSRRETSTGVRLVSYDPDGEDAVLAALLFRVTGEPYGEIRSRVREAGPERKAELLAHAMRGVGDHEAPVRELEHTSYTFEIVTDFGAYRDIQRHRMTTQTQQRLTCELGFAVPTDAREAGIADDMERAFDAAGDAWSRLADIDPDHAQYAVPLAFNKRILMTMNAREAHHFVRLRSRAEGHESYRRIAWGIRDEIERVHPAIAGLIPAEPM